MKTHEIPAFDAETLKKETIKNITKEGEQFLGLFFIGTIFGLTPSGKIYAPWTTNQSTEDMEADTEFWEKLEASIPKGFFLHHFEDSVFIAREIDADTEDLYSAVFVDTHTRDAFIETFGLREVSESELESSFEEMLDDCYEPYKIGYLTFTASEILKSDPVAFREFFLEHVNSQMEDEVILDIGGDYFYR